VTDQSDQLCASSSANWPMWPAAGWFTSIATSLCSIESDHLFVPTCLPAERRAQRQSRMPSRMRRHRRSRRAASCVSDMSDSLGVKVPCATWWRWST